MYSCQRSFSLSPSVVAAGILPATAPEYLGAPPIIPPFGPLLCCPSQIGPPPLEQHPHMWQKQNQSQNQAPPRGRCGSSKVAAQHVDNDGPDEQSINAHPAIKVADQKKKKGGCCWHCSGRGRMLLTARKERANNWWRDGGPEDTFPRRTSGYLSSHYCFKIELEIYFPTHPIM